jgi:DNA-binding transcriptional LysR family regulator
VELWQLRYFVALAEELHFGRAARRLRISQPPLSKQLKNLEEDLGVALFFRTRRKVELAPAGAALLEHARAILGRVEAAREDVRRAAGGPARVAVGFVTSTSEALLSAVLKAFRDEEPATEMVLRRLSAPEQFEALRAGTLHAGFVRTPVEAPADVALHPLLDDPLVLALPTRHRLARQRGAIAPEAVAGESLVLFPRASGPALYDEIRGVFLQAGVRVKLAAEVPDFGRMLPLVRDGVGLAVVPHSTPRGEGVVFRPLRRASVASGIALAWIPRGAPARVERFVGAARAAAERLAPARRRRSARA